MDCLIRLISAVDIMPKVLKNPLSWLAGALSSSPSTSAGPLSPTPRTSPEAACSINRQNRRHCPLVAPRHRRPIQPPEHSPPLARPSPRLGLRPRPPPSPALPRSRLQPIACPARRGQPPAYQGHRPPSP